MSEGEMSEGESRTASRVWDQHCHKSGSTSLKNIDKDIVKDIDKGIGTIDVVSTVPLLSNTITHSSSPTCERATSSVAMTKLISLWLVMGFCNTLLIDTPADSAAVPITPHNNTRWSYPINPIQFNSHQRGHFREKLKRRQRKVGTESLEFE